MDNPCLKCETGWEAISVDGCKSCRDTCEKLKQYEKADMNKPRICKVLGVEVEEEFTYDFGENQVRGTFKIGADGKRYYKDEIDTWYPCYSEEGLSVIINHPDRIIRKPCFTQQEVEDAKMVKAVLVRMVLSNGMIKPRPNLTVHWCLTIFTSMKICSLASKKAKNIRLMKLLGVKRSYDTRRSDCKLRKTICLHGRR